MPELESESFQPVLRLLNLFPSRHCNSDPGGEKTGMQKVADNFWVIWGHFWAILAILGHFRTILGNFGLFWVILGHFWAILGHFCSAYIKVLN